MPGNFRIAVVVGVVIILLTLTWAGSASSSPPRSGIRADAASGAVEWLNVTTSDTLTFGIAAPSEVTPGDTVHLVVTNLGSDPHTFTLSSVQGYVFASTASTSDLQSYFALNPPLVNLSIPGSVGAVVTTNFTAPAYGEYEYVCLEPGHFASGMSGILGSGEPGTTTALDTGPGTPVFIISGTIVGLVIMALVLGFVLGKRRGSEDEMPPERLGYPEPLEASPKP